jgi:hypothetical protein
MHRHGRSPEDLTIFLCSCLCLGIGSRAQGLQDVPTGYLTKVAGLHCDAMHHAQQSRECGSGWRQVARSEPRGKKKPERKSGGGELTGEAGPTLRAVVHRGYVVGGGNRV